MGDLTRSLSRHEIRCPCPCKVDVIDFDLPGVIQDVVDHFQHDYSDYDVKVHINSGNRCREYNATIEGASDKSQHTNFRAVDFYLHYINDDGEKVNIDEDEVAGYLESRYFDRYGIGRYIGRTHIDTRPVKARWDKRG